MPRRRGNRTRRRQRGSRTMPNQRDNKTNQELLEGLEAKLKSLGIERGGTSNTDSISQMRESHALTDQWCKDIDKIVERLEPEFEMDKETPSCVDFFDKSGGGPKNSLMHLIKTGLVMECNFYNREQVTEKLRSHGIQVFTHPVENRAYGIKLTRRRPSSLTENDTIVHDDCNLFGLQLEYLKNPELFDGGSEESDDGVLSLYDIYSKYDIYLPFSDDEDGLFYAMNGGLFGSDDYDDDDDDDDGFFFP